MSDSMAIKVERRQQGSHGAYFIELPGIERHAELTWVDHEGVRHANHTFVPEDMRGLGIAGRLVDALIADARDQGFRIEPRCSYVAAAFKRHPEWEGLRA
jgi:predicted GNAT family acetyltransferase